jgi:hypothetical protein
VTAGLIDAGNYFAPTVQPKGGVNLVAVMTGVVHAYNVSHVAELTELADGLPLLMQQLLRVAQILQLTSTAFAVIGTGRIMFFSHDFYPLFYDFSLFYHEFFCLQSPYNVLKYCPWKYYIQTMT